MTERIWTTSDLGQLQERGWGRLAHRNPAMRIEVLQAIAASSSRPLRPLAFALEDDAGLAAAALCEPVFAREDYNPLDSLLYGRGRRIAPVVGLSTRPLLAFAAPLGHGAPVLLRTDVGSAALHRLLDAIESHAAARRAGIAFLRVTADDEPLTSVLRERGYPEGESIPATTLDVQWEDLDGYVAQLRRVSLGAARTVRAELNRSRRAGVTIRAVPASCADPDALYALTRAHYRAKNATDPMHGPDFFRQLLPMLGEDLLVFEAVRGDRCLGVLVLVRSGSVGWPGWIGIDAAERANDFTYFNLVFYTLAARAPALGIRTLLYGSSVYEAKLRRGCRLVESRFFHRPHTVLGRAVARPYFGLHRAWQRRKNA